MHRGRLIAKSVIASGLLVLIGVLSQVPASASASGKRPAYIHTCTNVSIGSVCVGVTSAGVNYASFNNTSSSSVTAFVELGQVPINGSCTTGTVLAKTSYEVVPANGGHIQANKDTGVSSNWSATAYRKVGTTVSFIGRVCAAY